MSVIQYQRKISIDLKNISNNFIYANKRVNFVFDQIKFHNLKRSISVIARAGERADSVDDGCTVYHGTNGSVSNPRISCDYENGCYLPSQNYCWMLDTQCEIMKGSQASKIICINKLKCKNE